MKGGERGYGQPQHLLISCVNRRIPTEKGKILYGFKHKQGVFETRQVIQRRVSHQMNVCVCDILLKDWHVLYGLA